LGADFAQLARTTIDPPLRVVVVVVAARLRDMTARA
jgi:hypothetical protein